MIRGRRQGKPSSLTPVTVQQSPGAETTGEEVARRGGHKCPASFQAGVFSDVKQTNIRCIS